MACLACYGIWRIGRANWTWIMFASFVYLLVIRVGIAFDVNPIADLSRRLTVINLTLQAIALAMLWWSLYRVVRDARSRLARDRQEELLRGPRPKEG